MELRTSYKCRNGDDGQDADFDMNDGTTHFLGTQNCNDGQDADFDMKDVTTHSLGIRKS
jgi:hypothetical protein